MKVMTSLAAGKKLLSRSKNSNPEICTIRIRNVTSFTLKYIFLRKFPILETEVVNSISNETLCEIFMPHSSQWWI